MRRHERGYHPAIREPPPLPSQDRTSCRPNRRHSGTNLCNSVTTCRILAAACDYAACRGSCCFSRGGWMSRSPRAIVVAFLLSFVLVVSGRAASAQTGTGEIFGKVLDSTGAVLPGATVTISGEALITPQSTGVSSSGSYRFPNLPIGLYSVAFELAGVKRMVRAGVRIQAVFNAEVNGRLELSTVEETVTVTGESPIIDVRSNTLGTNFGKELLEAIPSARDPWVILEQTPGMVMSVQNVGGNISGQQASFGAHGSTSNQQWNLDGATITDMASSSSPGYFDFDSFE